MPPIAAVVAAEEPEMAAKNMQPTTATRARPPGNRPTRELMKLTSLSEMPPWLISVPERMKKGTAMKGKESQEVKSFLGTISRPVPVSTSTRTEESIREKPMGTFIMKRRSIEPNRISAMIPGDKVAAITPPPPRGSPAHSR